MRTHKGFSLIEVLVSLFLVTSVSLSIIQQQWHVSQFSNHIHRRSNALSQLDNSSEQWRSRAILNSSSNTVLVASWRQDSSKIQFERTMVGGI